MLSVEEREQIRRAFYEDRKSRRQIERELGHDRRTINKALKAAMPEGYRRKAARKRPVMEAWCARIDALAVEGAKLSRKQRYTAKRIYELIRAEGYGGSETSVRRYFRLRHKDERRPEIFLKLDYDPGLDAQADWG